MTKLYLAALAALALPAAAQAAPTPVTVVDEDFSLFTAGSETTPDATDITDPTTYTVRSEFTHIPGWPGGGVYQAGGVCYLGKRIDSYGGETTGFISTPPMELYGSVTLTFRARLEAPGEAEDDCLWFALCDNNSGPIKYYYPELTTEWQTFTYTMDNASTDSPCNFQFSTENVHAFIDDIKVVRTRDRIPAPDVDFPVNISTTEFEARWTPTNAPKHLLSVYYKQLPEVVKSGTIKELTGNPLQLNYNEKYVTGSGEEPLISLAFTLTPSDFDPYSYSMVSVTIHRTDGTSEVLAQLNPYYLEKYGTSFSYDEEILGENVKNVEFKYFTNDDDDITFTLSDITLDWRTQPLHHFILDREEVQGSSKVISGINPELDHFYYLEAQEDDVTSPQTYHMWVDGITGLKVKPLPASAIADDSFTANWEALPHASDYSVNVNRIITATTDMPGTVLVKEDFSKITTGEMSNPGTSINPTLNLAEAGMANTAWQAVNSMWVKGMIGSFGTTWYGAAGLVASPRISLANGDGSFKVKAHVQTTAPDDAMWVILMNQLSDSQAIVGISAETPEAGMHELEWVFPAGSGKEDVMVAFMSQLGVAYFIDDVEIIQDLKAGDNVSLPYTVATTTDNSATLRDLVTDSDFSYTVTALRTKDFMPYRSDESEAVKVDMPKSSVDSLLEEGITIRAISGGVEVTAEAGTEVRIFDIEGRTAAEARVAGTHRFNLAPGMYIVKAGKTTAKMIIR